VAEVKRNGSFLMLSGEDIGENIVLIPESADSACCISIRSILDERLGSIKSSVHDILLDLGVLAIGMMSIE